MANKKKLSGVEQQFHQDKTGRWRNQRRVVTLGGGFRLGSNIEVRFLTSGASSVCIEVATLKHVELEGGEIPGQDSEPPSDATGIWRRRRTLRKEDAYLRIGEHIFLRVHFGKALAVTFQCRSMAAVSVMPIGPEADVKDAA
ncbi:hypothetical protein COU79_03265 [Candidatus Peregrinibacteria bacterium CG10_big_fil_rev_8_21_14_0_10_54_7]|nr:MAG: hypothetical protein COU79_03265 [Candidatus Peregrinibacteria bacterium CG10_big_fil_rev_8_21_14_0_10_54_7]